MAAPKRRKVGRMEDEMDERKIMEEEMSRFEQEILTGQDEEENEDDKASCSPGPAIVPPGIPQALSVLGTPDPSLMNLRFPAPPLPTPAALQGMPTSSSIDRVGLHQQTPRGALSRFPLLPPPPPPGTIQSSTPLEPPGSYQHTVSTGDQRSTMSGPRPTQPFPPGVQQMTGEVAPMAPRPAFVPHQVRARAPMPPQRPLGSSMQRPPMLQHPEFMNSMTGPRGPMNYPPMHQTGGPRGPPAGPMIPPGYPMMHPHSMGMMQQSPAIIQAKPTTYSAKPVKFSKPKKEQKSKESTGTTKVETMMTVQPVHNVQIPAFTQPPAFTPPMVHNQAQIQMYTAAAQPAVVDYNTMTQQEQQHTDAAAGTSSAEPKKKKKKFIRIAANTVWEDESLVEWDPNDFRIFCGDLGNEVTDDLLTKVFGRYPSFTKAKVVRDKRTSKSKGYGFVSFKDPNDFVQAMREWNGKYVGNRPIKLRKSTWKDRNIDTFKKKQKEKQRLGLR